MHHFAMVAIIYYACPWFFNIFTLKSTIIPKFCNIFPVQFSFVTIRTRLSYFVTFSPATLHCYYYHSTYWFVLYTALLKRYITRDRFIFPFYLGGRNFDTILKRDYCDFRFPRSIWPYVEGLLSEGISVSKFAFIINGSYRIRLYSIIK